MLYSDLDRLLAAYEKAQDDLLAERAPEGHWVGELASSALATATAVSALSLVQSSRFKVRGLQGSGFRVQGSVQAKEVGTSGETNQQTSRDLGIRTWTSASSVEPDLGLLIERGIDYLSTQQNADGGFGDTDLSHSNIATTILVRAAFHLAASANEALDSAAADSATLALHRDLLDRAAKYVAAKGGIDGLRARYGKDKTFAIPILTNCALAGLVDWRDVSPLPFELAAFPQSWYRFFRLPVVSYAIPALVAIGQARFIHRKPRNPLVRALRAASVKHTLNVLERMQPVSGGYLEAIPLTSFVVMSLAGTGRANHPVVQRGVQFLLDTVRSDGSWPIDTNLATWVTTLATNALGGAGFRVQSSAKVWSAECGPSRAARQSTRAEASGSNEVRSAGNVVTRVVKWLLSCQHLERHRFTGAAPGGWGWSDLSGAVPDVDDTAGALLALARFADPAKFERRAPHGPGLHGCAYSAAIRGTCWLINLQNRDGGWPTFCRGWGTLPFDRSSPDLTAHAMRAIHSWSEFGRWGSTDRNRFVPRIERGFRYLAKRQRPDGSWSPLWFGNQDRQQEENPVYGTSRVLLAYRDLDRMSDEAAVCGVRWLIANQNGDGGWGSAALQASGRRESPDMAGTYTMQRNRGTNVPTSPDPVLNTAAACGSSVEETAWAVEGLLAGLDNRVLVADNSLQSAIRQGVDWLVRAVEDGWHRQPAPVGFYFAKLWYYERLYPLVFTVAALGEAMSRMHAAVERVTIKELGNTQEIAEQ